MPTPRAQVADGSAEKLLLAAVLLQAVRDLVVYSRAFTDREQRFADDARRWIFDGQEDAGHVASFENICLAMDLDRQVVRRQILGMCPEEMRRSVRHLRTHTR